MDADEQAAIHKRVQAAIEKEETEEMTAREKQTLRKQIQHREIERERRDGIRKRLATLVALLPTLDAKHKYQKAAVVREAIVYLKSLQAAVAFPHGPGDAVGAQSPFAPAEMAMDDETLDQLILAEHRKLARLEAEVEGLSLGRAQSEHPSPGGPVEGEVSTAPAGQPMETASSSTATSTSTTTTSTTTTTTA